MITLRFGAAMIFLSASLQARAATPADAPVCVQHANELSPQIFETSRGGKSHNSKPKEFDFAKLAHCLQNGDAQQTAALLIRLDDDAAPRNLKLTSISSKEATLPAKIQVLDDNFAVLKDYPFERFIKRNTDYCATVFLNGADSSRYLLITPDLDWLGRTSHSTAGNRWTMVWTTGLVTGVFSNGYESNKDIPFAIGGTLRVELEEDERARR